MHKNILIALLVVFSVIQYIHIQDNKFYSDNKDAQITDLSVKLNNKRFEIDRIHRKYQKQLEENHYKLTATAYTFSESECDSTPWRSAYGKSSYDGIAVSRDLIASGAFEPGDTVLIINGNNVMVRFVNDTMNARFTNRIDIPAKSKWWAKHHWGKREVKVVNFSAMQRKGEDYGFKYDSQL